LPTTPLVPSIRARHLRTTNSIAVERRHRPGLVISGQFLVQHRLIVDGIAPRRTKLRGSH
jgi:hypothetical protein